MLEAAWHEPKLAALRAARDTTRQSAIEHYAALVDAAPPLPLERIRVEDDQVIIGDVSVPRSSDRAILGAVLHGTP